MVRAQNLKIEHKGAGAPFPGQQLFWGPSNSKIVVEFGDHSFSGLGRHNLTVGHFGLQQKAKLQLTTAELSSLLFSSPLRRKRLQGVILEDLRRREVEVDEAEEKEEAAVAAAAAGGVGKGKGDSTTNSFCCLT